MKFRIATKEDCNSSMNAAFVYSSYILFVNNDNITDSFYYFGKMRKKWTAIIYKRGYGENYFIKPPNLRIQDIEFSKVRSIIKAYYLVGNSG